MSERASSQPNVLGTEITTFETLLPELLETNPGDWALIQQTELGGIFPEQADAITAGYGNYGNTPFLVRQILAEQAEVFLGYAEAA